ncbi:MAG: phosphomannomutase/phosphoglucomutase, partial [bacterium]
MQINPSIFKAYDIRGIYGQDLTNKTAEAIGYVFAQLAIKQTIVIGRDMSLSNKELFT